MNNETENQRTGDSIEALMLLTIGMSSRSDAVLAQKILDAIEDLQELQQRRNAEPVNDVTNGKQLTIPLPDTSSKAFWSGTGKNEVFHPESYKRWVKEAIERACVIAGIGVEVK